MKELRLRALFQQYVEGKLTLAEKNEFFFMLCHADKDGAENNFFTEDESARMLQFIKRQLEM